MALSGDYTEPMKFINAFKNAKEMAIIATTKKNLNILNDPISLKFSLITSHLSLWFKYHINTKNAKTAIAIKANIRVIFLVYTWFEPKKPYAAQANSPKHNAANRPNITIENNTLLSVPKALFNDWSQKCLSHLSGMACVACV